MIDSHLSLLSSSIPSQNGLIDRYNNRFNDIPMSTSSLKHSLSTATTTTTKSISTSSSVSSSRLLSNIQSGHSSSSSALGNIQARSTYGEGESCEQDFLCEFSTYPQARNAVEGLYQEYHSTFGVSISRIVDEHVRDFVKKTSTDLYCSNSANDLGLKGMEAQTAWASRQNDHKRFESFNESSLHLSLLGSGAPTTSSSQLLKSLPALSHPYKFGDLIAGRTLYDDKDRMDGLEGVDAPIRRPLPQSLGTYVFGDLSATRPVRSLKESRTHLRESIESSFISTIPVSVSGTGTGTGTSPQCSVGFHSIESNPDVEVAMASSSPVQIQGGVSSPNSDRSAMSMSPAPFAPLISPTRPVKTSSPIRSPTLMPSPSSPLPSPQLSPVPSPKTKPKIILDRGRIKFTNIRPREIPKPAAVPNPFDQFEDHDPGRPVPKVAASPVIAVGSASRYAHAGRWRKAPREEKEKYRSDDPANHWRSEAQSSTQWDEYRDEFKDNHFSNSPQRDRQHQKSPTSKKPKKRQRSFTPESYQQHGSRMDKTTGQRHDRTKDATDPCRSFNLHNSYNSYNSTNSYILYDPTYPSGNNLGAYNANRTGNGTSREQSQSFGTKERRRTNTERSPKRYRTRTMDPSPPPRSPASESDFSIASSRASSPRLEHSRTTSSEEDKHSTESRAVTLNAPAERGSQPQSLTPAGASIPAPLNARSQDEGGTFNRGDSPIPGLLFSTYVALDENSIVQETAPCDQQHPPIQDVNTESSRTRINDKGEESAHKHSYHQQQQRHVDMFDGDLSDDSSAWSSSSSASSRSNTPIQTRIQKGQLSRNSNTSSSSATPDTVVIVIPPKPRPKGEMKKSLSSIPLRNPPRSSTLKTFTTSVNWTSKSKRSTQPTSRSSITFPLTPPTTSTAFSDSPELSSGPVSLLSAPVARSRTSLPSTSKKVAGSVREELPPAIQTRTQTENPIFITTTCRTVLPLVMPEEYRTWLEEQEDERMSASGIQKLNMVASRMRRNAYLNVGSAGGKLDWNAPFPERTERGDPKLEESLERILKLRSS